MHLTRAEVKQVGKWIDSHTPRLKCPVCGKDNIQHPEPSYLWEAHGETNKRIILVPLHCIPCGFVMLFSADTMGLERLAIKPG